MMLMKKLFIEACTLASMADETPEGKSIVELAGDEAKMRSQQQRSKVY